MAVSLFNLLLAIFLLEIGGSVLGEPVPIRAGTDAFSSARAPPPSNR